MYATFKYAFNITIPILFGYSFLSFSFGILAINLGFDWYIPIFMSIFIYSGALQFLLIGLFPSNLALIDIFITSFLLNIRQIFYGLSFLNKFTKFKLYLIFSLTDETYLLLNNSIPKEINNQYYYLFVSLLNHIYWIVGTILGVIFAHFVKFNFRGLDFILVSLFTVLVIEQYKRLKVIFPFAIGIFSFAVMFIFKFDNILLYSILLSVFILFMYKRS